MVKKTPKQRLLRRLSSGLLMKITHCHDKCDDSVSLDSSVSPDTNNNKDTTSPFGPSLSSLRPGSFLNREWEIVTVEEVKRRLSLQELVDVSKFPLPDGATDSKILSEDQIRELVRILPVRAEGYPWTPVFSTAEHGFSLHTMYRSMAAWGEEMSPTLLVIQDTEQTVFGAIVNCPLTPSEHFYGTGESLLFSFAPSQHLPAAMVGPSGAGPLRVYRWSGSNNFFVKGNKDSLSIGAGKGKFGLWLDEDLYHGRSQRCETFDNEPLSISEDFIVASMEAWGFSMQ